MIKSMFLWFLYFDDSGWLCTELVLENVLPAVILRMYTKTDELFNYFTIKTVVYFIKGTACMML